MCYLAFILVTGCARQRELRGKVALNGKQRIDPPTSGWDRGQGYHLTNAYRLPRSSAAFLHLALPATICHRACRRRRTCLHPHNIVAP